jgi:hypothetical protein
MSIDPSRPGAVFGRRGLSASTASAPPKVVAQKWAGSPYAKPKAEPFIVRYNWKIAMVGISLLGMTYKAYGAISAADHGWDMVTGRVPISQEVANYAMLGVGMGLIGLLWLSRFFSRAPALRMDEKGVKGFTLLGTKYIAWEDVEYVKIEYHPFYKQQITIRAVLGSPTGGYFLYGIPLKTAALNRSCAEIVDAIRSFAPNVNISDTSAEGKTARTLADFFSWVIKHSHH